VLMPASCWARHRRVAAGPVTRPTLSPGQIFRRIPENSGQSPLLAKPAFSLSHARRSAPGMLRATPDMDGLVAPIIYYVRHGLTDWNVHQRLQGRHDVALNKEGRAQSMRCGEILRELMSRDGRTPSEFDYVSSPLVRASKTMELMRMALDLEPGGYRVEPRLIEIAFGEWEGLTYAEVLARDKGVIARRESDKWGFVPPGGESYAQVGVRVSQWHASVAADTVVAAHGGTARALIAYLGLAPPQDASSYSIEQGVVYVFAGNQLARYG
jgi:broad specificity phosphatase PhoE